MLSYPPVGHRQVQCVLSVFRAGTFALQGSVQNRKGPRKRLLKHKHEKYGHQTTLVKLVVELCVGEREILVAEAHPLRNLRADAPIAVKGRGVVRVHGAPAGDEHRGHFLFRVTQHKVAQRHIYIYPVPSQKRSGF